MAAPGAIKYSKTVQHKKERNSMFRIGICDDEEAIRSEIEKIILQYSLQTIEEIEVFVFKSGEEICRFMQERQPLDLVFLDIELNMMNGVEVAGFIRDNLKNEAVQIVFVSAKDSYYQQLFDSRPMHFLHKPLAAEFVIKDIQKAMKLSGKMGQVFLYKQGHATCRQPLKDIIYFESLGRQIKMATVKEDICFYGKLGDVTDFLKKHRFFATHKSYLVNYMHVIEFRQKELVMSNKIIIPVSRQKSSEVMNILLSYEKEGV